jgi:LCP family protein required for cell wall assembly
VPHDPSPGDRPRPSAPIANQDRLLRLGEAVERRTGHGTRTTPRSAAGAAARRVAPRRRRRWLRRTVLALGLVVVLVVGAVVGDYYYLGSLVHRTDVGNLQSAGTTENILLIGSTTRCGLKVQNKAYGLCAQGVTGVNSDIDMILHLDTGTHTVSLLSIPRDLFIPNARTTGPNKIDAALYQGPTQLVAAIEEDLAIPINHYVELNFDTFASVVDALGGVRMYFPVPIYDAESGLNIERSGCYLLSGYRSLQLVRARHLQIQPTPTNHDPHTWPQEALSDLARIRRTHEFLRVLAAKVATRGLGDPLVDQSIATAVLPDLTVDSGFGESSMVHLAEEFAHTSIADAPQYTYPVLTVQSGSLLYQGYYYGDLVFPVQPSGAATVDSILDVAAGVDSFTGKPLPRPRAIRVAIDNGSGVASEGPATLAGLRRHGFDVVADDTVTPVGPVSESVVWYGGPRPPLHGDWTSPSLAAAEAVLGQLEGPAILGYDPSMVAAGSEVTVQAGTDLTVKPVATPTTTTTTKHHTTTTTSSSTKPSTTTTTAPVVVDPPGVKSNNDFSAPSSVDPSLEPWDPRPCNAAGTGPVTASPTTTSAAGTSH